MAFAEHAAFSPPSESSSKTFFAESHCDCTFKTLLFFSFFHIHSTPMTSINYIIRFTSNIVVYKQSRLIIDCLILLMLKLKNSRDMWVV